MLAETPTSQRFRSTVTVACSLAILVIVTVCLRELRTLLQPLAISIFLFYMGAPFVRKLIRLKIPPFLAHMIMVGLIVGALALLIYYAGDYLDQLGQQLPA